MKCYYFGAIREAGHFFWDKTLTSHKWEYRDTQPWGEAIDNIESTVKHGDTFLRHKDEWSALTIGDRSVDSRDGSHSTFIFEKANLTVEEAKELAYQHFPSICYRILVHALKDDAEFHASIKRGLYDLEAGRSVSFREMVKRLGW